MQTIWGKLSLILFYSFIWAGILSSAWSVLFPLSQGGGCVMEYSGMDKKESTEEMFKVLMRCLHIFVIGFLLYADVGGMTIKNTTMVFIFMAANSFAALSVRHVTEKCHLLAPYYVVPGWVFLAWTLLVLEVKTSDRGSTRERESLNV
jgi:predicted acyltransferase